jgi:hypothetical protein
MDLTSFRLAEAREKENLLQDERNKSQDLDIRVQQMEAELREAADRYREQVRSEYVHEFG